MSEQNFNLKEKAYNLGLKCSVCYENLKIKNIDEFYNLSDDLKYYYLFGLLEKRVTRSSGYMSFYDSLNIEINFEDLSKMLSFINIPVELSEKLSSRISDVNSLDLLSILFKKVDLWGYKNIYLTSLYEHYKYYCSINLGAFHGDIPLFQYTKVDERAVAPFKARASDSGYDLTLIDVYKVLSNVTTVYRTGIKVQMIAPGWYFDLVPRSSVIKSGYMLSNCIGIIDRGYTGEIYVALSKIDSSMPDLTLPNRIVQLIPRQIIHGEFKEVKELNNTDRNEGGFGSSTGRDQISEINNK